MDQSASRAEDFIAGHSKFPSLPRDQSWSRQESAMQKFEYRSVVLSFQMGVFKQGLPDIQAALNREALDGWRFRQIVQPASLGGQSDSMVVILERPLPL
jgi:hypothetical protein